MFAIEDKTAVVIAVSYRSVSRNPVRFKALGDTMSLRTTVPFVTARLEIFHCTHRPVIPESDLYFTFCSTLRGRYSIDNTKLDPA